MPKAKIYYHDIGDYLSREEKLAIVKKFGSVKKILWKELKTNEHGDWISQRSDIFETLIPIDSNKKFDLKTQSYFNTHSLGLATGRDAWVINYAKDELSNNVRSSISFYNKQVQPYHEAKTKNPKLQVDSFIDASPTKISWNRNLKNDLEKKQAHNFNESSLVTCIYRPFSKSHLYFDKDFNAMLYQNKKLFPDNEIHNLVICTSGTGGSKDFSVLIADKVPILHFVENGQSFPLYYYEERKKSSPTLFDEAGEGEFIRRDGISDFILERAKKQYGKNVGKEDIFYYVYGILHSPDYRTAFANDLKKMLPRIPLVEDVRDFWKFSKAGRQLAELHINYESVPAYEGVEVTGADTEFYRVEKMRFPKKDQKDKIIFNSKILISNIPEKAYEYVVNGKSAIEWIMERYQITTHKESGIKNDPNDWAEEVGNPRYILDLLLSVINVSVQTVGIVEGLPGLGFKTIARMVN